MKGGAARSGFSHGFVASLAVRAGQASECQPHGATECRRPACCDPLQVKACCVLNAGVILSTLAATLIHATAITRSVPGCTGSPLLQLRREWCFNPNTKVQAGGHGGGPRELPVGEPPAPGVLLPAGAEQRAGRRGGALLPAGVLHSSGGAGLRLLGCEEPQLHAHGERRHKAPAPPVPPTAWARPPPPLPHRRCNGTGHGPTEQDRAPQTRPRPHGAGPGPTDQAQAQAPRSRPRPRSLSRNPTGPPINAPPNPQPPPRFSPCPRGGRAPGRWWWCWGGEAAARHKHGGRCPAPRWRRGGRGAVLG